MVHTFAEGKPEATVSLNYLPVCTPSVSAKPASKRIPGKLLLSRKKLWSSTSNSNPKK